MKRACHRLQSELPRLAQVSATTRCEEAEMNIRALLCRAPSRPPQWRRIWQRRRPTVRTAARCSRRYPEPPLNGATPTGKGDWRGTPACTGVDLRIEVRHVNLSNGTVSTLDTCGRQLSVALNGREARFEIKENAPTCTVGQAVTVRVGATTIASGAWCNPLFARCD
jgi:hypothetical protein